MLQSNILLDQSPAHCIKDVAVNWHGTKMAVCSNNSVIMWSMNSQQKWIKEEVGIELDKLKTVQRISWAHPEFGQVLAVSTLNEISIWEYRFKLFQHYTYNKFIEDSETPSSPIPVLSL